MLIDNKNELIAGQEKTIYQYLNNNLIEKGRFDFVTGYFTISAISKLYDSLKPQSNYRIILGDLFSVKPTRQNIIDIIHLRDTVVFNKLYLFQQKGVLSLIRMLQNYNGAILADAVGLEKT